MVMVGDDLGGESGAGLLDDWEEEEGLDDEDEDWDEEEEEGWEEEDENAGGVESQGGAAQ
jgi:hypothetical protein